MLEISHLSFSYPNLQVLNDLSIKIKEKEIVSVIGKRHSGKSTLFKLVSGLENPDSGNIIFMGNSILKNRYKFLNGYMICLDRYKGLFSSLTVKENIELGAWHIKDKKVFKQNFDRTLELIPHLQKYYNKNVKKLCNGEKMLTAIARAVVAFPELIVIDEPTFGFYPLFAEKILNLISRSNQLGITFLLIQKKNDMSVKISDWIYELEDGEIIKQGDSKSFEKFDFKSV